jgi:hypothetical protein
MVPPLALTVMIATLGEILQRALPAGVTPMYLKGLSGAGVSVPLF